MLDYLLKNREGGGCDGEGEREIRREIVGVGKDEGESERKRDAKRAEE